MKQEKEERSDIERNRKMRQDKEERSGIERNRKKLERRKKKSTLDTWESPALPSPACHAQTRTGPPPSQAGRTWGGP
jgi:hypothetical protein